MLWWPSSLRGVHSSDRFPGTCPQLTGLGPWRHQRGNVASGLCRLQPWALPQPALEGNRHHFQASAFSNTNENGDCKLRPPVESFGCNKMFALTGKTAIGEGKRRACAESQRKQCQRGSDTNAGRVPSQGGLRLCQVYSPAQFAVKRWRCPHSSTVHWRPPLGQEWKARTGPPFALAGLGSKCTVGKVPDHCGAEH